MKLLFDLFPVILFFVSFKLAGTYPEQSAAFASSVLGGLVAAGRITAAQAPILIATAMAIVASFAQVGWLLARGRKIEPMLWISLGVIAIFGGATIWLNDETFIKWKPSVLYWLFGAVLMAARYGWRRNLVRSLLGTQLSLPDFVWERLLSAWVAFFAAMGAVNVAVAYSVSTDAWVNFKLFGLLGLTLAFMLAIGVYLSRHIQEVGDA